MAISILTCLIFFVEIETPSEEEDENNGLEVLTLDQEKANSKLLYLIMT